jgi:hypothetical protein
MHYIIYQTVLQGSMSYEVILVHLCINSLYMNYIYYVNYTACKLKESNLMNFTCIKYFV